MKNISIVSIIALACTFHLHSSERFTDVRAIDIKGAGKLIVQASKMNGIEVFYPEGQRPVRLQKDANGQLIIVCTHNTPKNNIGASAFIGSASVNGPAVSNFGTLDFTVDGWNNLLAAHKAAEQTVSPSGPQINIHVSEDQPLDSLMIQDGALSVIGYVAKAIYYIK